MTPRTCGSEKRSAIGVDVSPRFMNCSNCADRYACSFSSVMFSSRIYGRVEQENGDTLMSLFCVVTSNFLSLELHASAQLFWSKDFGVGAQAQEDAYKP